MKSGPWLAGRVKVIGFTGMPGAGKSEAVAVAQQRGVPVVRMGDLVWEEVERRGLPRSAEHVGPVANAMRQEQGADVWARRTVDVVRRLHGDAAVVLVDGIRSMQEVDHLRAELGADFVLVAIHTDQAERFERMTRRARADDPAAATGHQARDQREMEWGIARTIALADEMVVNDGDLGSFHQEVAALLDELAGPLTRT